MPEEHIDAEQGSSEPSKQEDCEKEVLEIPTLSLPSPVPSPPSSPAPIRTHSLPSSPYSENEGRMRDDEEGMREYDEEDEDEERRDSDSENPGRRRKSTKPNQIQVKFIHFIKINTIFLNWK